MLQASMDKYYENRPMKWFICGIGVLIGCLLGLGVPKIYTVLSSSLYDRSSIENLMAELIGGRHVKEAMMDEVMLVAYEYNSQQPRFYSKYYADINPGVYDVLYSKACGGSSAAPLYFEPQQVIDSYGLDQLVIDGGIIANNPALYAYILQKEIKGKTPIRILSLGTGTRNTTKFEPEDITRFQWLQLSSHFMVDVDAYATDGTLSAIMADQAKSFVTPATNYLRLQTESTTGLDKFDPESIAELKADGLSMYEANKEALQKMIREICDEKFAA